MRRSPRHRVLARVAVATAAGLAVALTAGACSGSGGGSDATSGSAGSPAVGAPEPGGGRDAAGDQPTQGEGVASGGAGVDGKVVGAPAAPAVTGRRLIRTGDMTVRVPDVLAAGARVRSLTAAAKGIVADERTTTGGPGEKPGSTITVRVPETALDKVMDDVARLGEVRTRSQSSQDVTDAVVDTTSRVASQRASVERIRALLARARDISQIVQIEAELARRQADLDSLEAQLAALEDQTALATLSVSLTTAAVEDEKADTGFLAGLAAGWKAFTGSGAVLLTAFGAALPFLGLALLLAVAARAVLRRRTRTGGPSAPLPQAPTAGP